MKFDFKGIWVEWTQWGFCCAGSKFIRAHFWSLLVWGSPQEPGGGVCPVGRAGTERSAGSEMEEEECVSLERSARPSSKSWSWRVSVRTHPPSAGAGRMAPSQLWNVVCWAWVWAAQAGVLVPLLPDPCTGPGLARGPCKQKKNVGFSC